MSRSTGRSVRRRTSRSGSTTSAASGCAPATCSDLVDDKHVVGVTSNPTIFQKALEKGDAYDEQVRDLGRPQDRRSTSAIRYLMAYDIRWACDVLRPVYDRTDGKDGRVSIEVDPRLAHDTERTIAEAKALWWLVDRPERA